MPDASVDLQACPVTGRGSRAAGVQPFPYLLLPWLWASRNRARRRERGDLTRALLFGGIAAVVTGAIFQGAWWLTTQLAFYAELGDYLIRLGLAWLFLTFLSFIAFSAIVTSLSTFFLADDLRLLLTAPVDARRLFHARFTRTFGQASWMVMVFMTPVLAGVGVARAAPLSFYVTAVITILPFAIIPVAIGSVITLGLVNVFPARRARDVLMLMGLVFATSLVLLLRFIQPERLLRVESMPEVTAFFATLQSPISPLLPSFWAGETLFASLQGGWDPLHLLALWTTALAAVVVAAGLFERWHFTGFSKAQEARKVRFARWALIDRLIGTLPLRTARRQLLVKDLKVFLRDVSQWSQLLLLVALVLVYLYNFSVLDLDRAPMGRVLRNLYAFLNLGLAGFVMATVAVRFVFPLVSSEGAAFWVIRTAPVALRDFLWSKFWTGLVPVLALSLGLTVAGNELLGVDPFLKRVSAVTIVFMAFALVGLATGLGARYPRFAADSPSQVAGSYGGVAFMILAVLFVIVVVALVGWPSSVYLIRQVRRTPVSETRQMLTWLSFAGAGIVSVATFWLGMRSGIRALDDMDGTPS